MMQLGLGFCAYLTRMVGAMTPCSRWQIMVVSTVAHVAGGALVLATTVVLAIQSRRMITRCRTMNLRAELRIAKAVIA